MPRPEIEEFAKILVQQVRDAAIQGSERNLSADANHVIAKRWKEAANDGNLNSVAPVLISDVVDGVSTSSGDRPRRFSTLIYRFERENSQFT